MLAELVEAYLAQHEGHGWRPCYVGEEGGVALTTHSVGSR
jgi:hypothetical protein